MSVYSELVRIGIHDHEAGQIAEALIRNDNLATKQDIQLAISTLEANLAWRVITTLLAVTAIFATIVGIIFNLSKIH
jgi:hypothetical protein